MNNCLLCKNCMNEAEGIDGYPVEPWYHCDIRETLGYDDPRFPYKNTKCKHFKEDTCVASLTIKEFDKEVWDLITWDIE